MSAVITKDLVSSDPASPGEAVVFDIGLDFSGTDQLVDGELIDVFENEYLGFRSVSLGNVPLECALFAGTPDAAHSMVVCDLGTVMGPITVQAEFEALKATIPDRSRNEASAEFDPDGDGPEARMRIGPDAADVEIVEVLALPPLGDGPVAGTTSSASAATSAMLGGLAVALAVAGRMLNTRRPGARS